MNKTTVQIFIAGLWHRPLASGLSFVAIMLGVALALAVHLVHRISLQEFDHGMRQLTGTVDLQVVGPQSGFDENLYFELALAPGVRAASPVVEAEAVISGREDKLLVLGVDLFRMARTNPSLLSATATVTQDNERLTGLRQDRVFLSSAARRALQLNSGDTLILQGMQGAQSFEVAEQLPQTGYGGKVAVMDIAAAQRLFDMYGRLSRVDLVLEPGIPAEVFRRRQSLLPAGCQWVTPELTQAQSVNLTRAYRVNMAMLSTIALITGGFMVFSTQWLSVVRRRREFAFLRALGLTRLQLQRALLAEGGIIGTLAGVFGVLCGYMVTALLLRRLGGDLGAGLFHSIRPDVPFYPWLSILYVLLGTVAGMAGAWLPAREAARIMPARGLRAGDDNTLLETRPHYGLALFCLLLALCLCFIPPWRGIPVAAYIAVVLTLCALCLLLPLVLQGLTRLLPVTGPVMLLAGLRLRNAAGQGVVAGAGVAVSVALASAMTMVVVSFRVSVQDWLQIMLPADIYVSTLTESKSSGLSAELVQRIAILPGVAEVQPIRFDLARIAQHAPMVLIAREVVSGGYLPMADGHFDARILAAAPGEQRVWLSEAAADTLRLKKGDPLMIPIHGREFPFTVAGVWRDYARQQGALMIELPVYRQLSGDTLSNNLGIVLSQHADTAQLDQALLGLVDRQKFRVVSVSHIRTHTLQIFDRTFLITYLMEAIAILIGLAGICASFAALVVNRRHEFGVLRHLGMRRRDVALLLAAEGGLTAASGVVAGMGAGGLIALMLVKVINRQSFHWSMNMHVPLSALLIFALVMIVLAAVAATLSGRQVMRRSAVLAVKEDW